MLGEIWPELSRILFWSLVRVPSCGRCVEDDAVLGGLVLGEVLERRAGPGDRHHHPEDDRDQRQQAEAGQDEEEPQLLQPRLLRRAAGAEAWGGGRRWRPRSPPRGRPARSRLPSRRSARPPQAEAGAAGGRSTVDLGRCAGRRGAAAPRRLAGGVPGSVLVLLPASGAKAPALGATRSSPPGRLDSGSLRWGVGDRAKSTRGAVGFGSTPSVAVVLAFGGEAGAKRDFAPPLRRPCGARSAVVEPRGYRASLRAVSSGSRPLRLLVVLRSATRIGVEIEVEPDAGT